MISFILLCQNRLAPFGVKNDVLSFESESAKQHDVETSKVSAPAVSSTTVANGSSHGLASRVEGVAVSPASWRDKIHHDGNSCRPSEGMARQWGFAEERSAPNSLSVPTGPAGRFTSSSLSHRAVAKDADSAGPGARHPLRGAVPAAQRLVERMRGPLHPKHPCTPASPSMTRRSSAAVLPLPHYSRRAGLPDDAHPPSEPSAPGATAPASLSAIFVDRMDLSSTSSPSVVATPEPTRLLHTRPRADSCDGGSAGGGSSRSDDWMDIFSAFDDCPAPAQRPSSPDPGTPPLSHGRHLRAARLCAGAVLPRARPRPSPIPTHSRRWSTEPPPD
jgi:hypothetical protein